MNKKEQTQFFQFLEQSPTAFHATFNIAKTLKSKGFLQLFENKKWKLTPGGSYYVIKNDSSIIAFSIGKKPEDIGFNITAVHGDSPALKLKEKSELITGDVYTRLSTEGYGGMIMSTWFDRPLSVAGRVVIKSRKSLVSRLINIDKDLLLIPNVAIHMDRSINDGYKYNLQTDVVPLFAGSGRPGAFKRLIAVELGVDETDIMGSDLFVYNRQKVSVWGSEEEFFSAPRIDNLECSYLAAAAFADASPDDSVVNVYACFDNEEVGSQTRQGANSTFMEDVLKRICIGLGISDEGYYQAIANSFMISADNGHAVHPNHPEHTDSANCVYMNRGVVIKSHAGQRYISDGLSSAVINALAKSAKVPLQYFSNRSDRPGGSTLGNISLSHVSLNSVDIGLAMLAMHSSYETAGIKDADYMRKLFDKFYSTSVRMTESGVSL